MIGLVDLTPSPQYLDVIRRGANQNGIPEKYQQWLGSIEDNGYSGEVKIMNQIANNGTSEKDDTFLYFSFGSNMLKARIHINNPTAELVGPAKLQGYRLCYRPYSGYDQATSYWRGAPASIDQDTNDHVWGVVWKLNKSDLEHLDSQESSYHALEVAVTTPEGEEQVCRTYQITEVLPEEPPSPQYLSIMIEGAKQCGVPAPYINRLCATTHNEDSSPLPFVDKLLKVSP